RLTVLAAASLVLPSCQSARAADPTHAPDLTGTAIVRSSWTPIPVIAPFTPTFTPSISPIPPTATPVQPTATPSITRTPTATLTSTASPSPIPTNTRRPTVTLTPSIAVTTISTIVPGPFGGDTETWTPQPLNQNLKAHFVFQRPVSNEDVT